VKMTRRTWSLVIAALAAASAVCAAQNPPRSQPFPHVRHERLFPTCDGCHAGIPKGDVPTSFPSEAQCRECHNGTDAQVVGWRRSVRPAGLLRFSHPSHANLSDSVATACATCHSPGRASRMDVSRPVPATCLGCHAHAASGHLADDNRCSTCHIPVTAARDISAEHIATFPQPPSHQAAGFATNHASAIARSAATCAMCHSRESCERCHVNASTMPQIMALARDPRIASLVAAKPASYPTPEDHRNPAFAETHGATARRDIGRCGTCHTRASCATCHTGPLAGDVLQAMPQAGAGGAPGVELRDRPTRIRLNPPSAALSLAAAILSDSVSSRPAPAHVVRVHDIGFRNAHGTEAAAGMLPCSGCHAQRFCSECHAGEGKRRFHAENFEVRHAADAYGRETECSTCHNAEVFCRGCHRQAGLGSRGRLDVAFHTAQPLWLLQHGRAARQGLSNCTTCHAQRDCLTCHSTTGWGISPHGPNFDADRMAKNAAPMCLRCHLQIPPGRRSP
jgi:hypothetical protein